MYIDLDNIGPPDLVNGSYKPSSVLKIKYLSCPERDLGSQCARASVLRALVRTRKHPSRSAFKIKKCGRNHNYELVTTFLEYMLTANDKSLHRSQ